MCVSFWARALLSVCSRACVPRCWALPPPIPHSSGCCHRSLVGLGCGPQFEFISLTCSPTYQLVAYLQRIIVTVTVKPTCLKKRKRQIGDHTLPQWGFGLGTPEGAEGGWAAPGNTGRGRQRERAQATVHQTSSNHACTSRHCRISNRCANQKDKTGKNRAHSNRNRAGTSGQEAERVQEPRHAKTADSSRVKRVNMQRPAQVHSRYSVIRQDIQKIKPQISWIRALKR
jgi:hypothetical protein